MKRFFLISLLILLIGVTTWWLSRGEGMHAITNYVENGDILTLETRYTPDAIMEAHRKELIGSSQRIYQEPSLFYHPYLLLDVKYYDQDQKTKQGSLLWSLVDGEMVLNTDTWEKTHGFEDAINANATAQELRLLNTLDNHAGLLSREKLQKELGLEQDSLTALIENAKQKQLVISKGNDVILHFENPKFNVSPQTKVSTALVMKPARQGKKLSAKYSRAKIERIAKAAFGSDFTIRSIQEIYLPVLRIEVANPDGSLLITHWNALTGEQIS